MTEKRFTYDSKTVSILKDGEIWLDGSIDTACNHGEICDLLNEQDDEIMDLRAELTKFKLVIKDVVADLEQQAESREPIVINKAYAKWIKDNVNLRLNSEKEDRG